jgi:hypothetical protein
MYGGFVPSFSEWGMTLGDTGMMVGQSSVPGTGTGGMLLSKVVQDEASDRQDLLGQPWELGHVSDR